MLSGAGILTMFALSVVKFKQKDTSKDIFLSTESHTLTFRSEKSPICLKVSNLFKDSENLNLHKPSAKLLLVELLTQSHVTVTNSNTFYGNFMW